MKEQQIYFRRHILIACYLLVGVYLLMGLYLLSGLSGPGRYYRSGIPAGADFLQIWAASAMAKQGQAALVYNPAELKRMETAIIGGNFSGLLPWHYPPSFLWLIMPLASLNYFLALALWLGLSLGGLLFILYRIFPDRLTIWLALASIATADNLYFGQGAFLIAIFMGSGLLLLDSHPLLAGALFGLLLNYKPHLAILIFLALLAGRRWRVMGALITTGAALVMISSWVLGLQTWLAFWKDLSFMRLQLGDANLWDRMPTVFAAIRLLGGSERLAQSLQVLTALGAALSVYWVWSNHASFPIRGAVLVAGSLLVTPHACNYDLTLLLLPLAWVAREEHDLPWGRLKFLMLGLVWLLPFLNLVSVELARIHLAPLLLAAFLIYLLTEATGGRRAATAIASRRGHGFFDKDRHNYCN